MNETIFISSEKNVQILIKLASFLVVLFVVIFCMAIVLSKVALIVLNIVVLVYLGSELIYLIKRYAGKNNASVVISVNNDGVLDKSLFLSPGFIPWENIKSVKVFGGKFIGIRVKSVRNLLRQVSVYRRIHVYLNTIFFMPNVQINTTRVEQSTEEVYHAIKQMMDRDKY